MSFGQITIARTSPSASIIMDCTDQNSTFGFQPSTIYSSLEPGRSTYGTAQDIAPVSTNSVKRLWTFSGVLLPASYVNTLRIFLTSTTRVFTLTDELWEKLITGSNATNVNVRLISNGDWLGRAYTDSANNTTQFEVSFAAWEI